MDDDAWAVAMKWAEDLSLMFENNAPKDLVINVNDSSESCCMDAP